MIKQCKYVLYKIYNTYSRRLLIPLGYKAFNVRKIHTKMNTDMKTPQMIVDDIKNTILSNKLTEDEIQSFIDDVKLQLDELVTDLNSSAMYASQDTEETIDEESHKITISNTERTHAIELLSQQLCQWLQDNMHVYVKMNFVDILKNTVNEFIEDIVQDMTSYMVSGIQHEEQHFDDIRDELSELTDCVVDTSIGGAIIPRSYTGTFIPHTTPTLARKKQSETREKLERINELNKSVPEQRTMEWYMYRHNLLSASNIHDAFNSIATRNRIIFDKCSPLDLNKYSARAGSLHTPFEKGTRYEPVSQSYYELVYATRISEYGCLPHTKYPFIGASPDGINTDKSSPLYGRMLEIKNVVSREITGIPKEDYWVQMQIQMETCDLDECDFLECNFKEYENYNDFINDSYNETHDVEDDTTMNVSYKNVDTMTSFTHTKNGELKGIILCFTNDGKYHYEYKPILMSEEKYEEWEQKMMDKNDAKGMKWIHTFYWRLQYVSCVLVPRNKQWFMSVVDKIKDTWETIEKERITGYQHRAPRRRSPPSDKKTTPKKTHNVIKLDTEVMSTETITDDTTQTSINNNVIETSKIEVKEITPTPSPQLKPKARQTKFSGLFLKVDT